MQVLKFGGSSVADATRISAVMDIVEAALARDRVILVCSAISGCTDALIEIGRTSEPAARAALIGKLRDRHLGIVRRLFTGAERESAEAMLGELFCALENYSGSCFESFGELFSTRIIERKFACDGVGSLWLDSRKLVMTAGGKVDEGRTYPAMAAAVAAAPDVRLFVAPGFIASDENGQVTTLGRGGSDYSAALYAAGTGADTLQIWTDVPGIMTANPKVVPSAQTIPDISYRAALELAENGAKVLYAPTVMPAMEKGTDINIRNTFDPRHPGTVISGRFRPAGDAWMGVTSLAVPGRDESRLCIVGEAVASRRAAAGRMVSALAEAGISPVGEVYGEGGVFFVNVKSLVENEAVAALHREFFEDRSVVSINVFLAGYGAVGKALVELAERSRSRIEARTGRSINIVGVSDSRRFVIDMRGIPAEDIPMRLAEGESAEGGAYVAAVCAAAPRKSVFADCTDDHSLYLRYEELLRSGVNVVTSNRRSVAVPYVQYAAIKAAARENGAYFRYDTTVGNALPILESIAGSANCSDGIESVEAVVSCTLNYVITGYDGARSDSLATLLRRAQSEGLTETDPRTDLGGRDVLRKLLIMAREAGIPLEEQDVEITPMLGPEFFDCPLDEFYARLAAYEPRFIQREAELDNAGLRQRFVASLRRDPAARLGYKAEIRMRLVGMDSPFYWISGTENVTVVRSEYSSPLVIKGAGEGVKLAATGIIKDILMQ